MALKNHVPRIIIVELSHLTTGKFSILKVGSAVTQCNHNIHLHDANHATNQLLKIQFD